MVNAGKSMAKKEILIDSICCLFIVLFCYTAVSKLLDFENFSIELHKSPMLVDFSGVIAWAVPLIEILVALSLVPKRTRLAALYASLSLMAVFTFYIVSIIGFSEYVPCTCGGVLQKMSWGQHLVFNIFFLGLAAYGIYLSSARPYLRTAIAVMASVVAAASANAALFAATYVEDDKFSSFNVSWLSEKLIAEEPIDITVNSWYFAGEDERNIFLGNRTAHGLLMKIASHSGTRSRMRIPEEKIPQASTLSVAVRGSYSFLYDHRLPFIRTVNLNSTSINNLTFDHSYFDSFVPVKENHFGLRISDDHGDYSLALLSADSGLVAKPELLKTQVDGKFCRDGMLVFNRNLKRFAYVYYYRNQFIVTDSLLNHPLGRETIDSVRVAKIKVNKIPGSRNATVVVPEVTVSKNCFAYAAYIFIWSGIRAKNEDPEVFKKFPRIDAYEFITGNYLGSFHLPLERSLRPREFMAKDDALAVLAGNALLRYNMTPILSELDKLRLKKFYRPVR